MGFPRDIVLVRHGQSEGNFAMQMAIQGDESYYTRLTCPSSFWRLTDLGVYQAKLAGAWIRDSIGEEFDRYYASEYVRALETAAHLELPRARWYQSISLRERDEGVFDCLAPSVVKQDYPGAMAQEMRDPFFYRPPNGESIAALCERVDKMIDTLRTECDGKRIIIVCHGHVMWAFRIRLERLTSRQYREMRFDEQDIIGNAHILHYTRDPAVRDTHMQSVRLIDPTVTPARVGLWRPIMRRYFTNEELLTDVEHYTRIFTQ